MRPSASLPTLSDIRVEISIHRPPHEVRAWWWEMPDDYRATDPKEEPHRIVTVSRSADHRDMLTYWRGPGGRVIEVPERMRMDAHGDWTIEVDLPFGLAQRDVFELHPRADATHVTIDVDVWPRAWYGRLARPFFLRYARKWYPRTWNRAAKICERDAPTLPIP